MAVISEYVMKAYLDWCLDRKHEPTSEELAILHGPVNIKVQWLKARIQDDRNTLRWSPGVLTIS